MICPMSYESQEVSVRTMLKESTVGFSPLLYFEDAGAHDVVVFTDDGVQELLFFLGTFFLIVDLFPLAFQ